MFPDLSKAISTVAMAILLSQGAVVSTGGAQTLKISVTSVENVERNLFRIKYSITNRGPSAVFFPTQGLQKKIWSLHVQRLQREHDWISLPAHRELPPDWSDALRLDPGGTYEGELHLENPFYVSRWIAYPRQAYLIRLDGKLRLAVSFLVGEKERDDYVSKLTKRKPTPKEQAELLNNANLVASEPFKLPMGVAKQR